MSTFSKAVCAAAAATSALFIGSRIDEKYSISTDIAQIHSARKQRKYWEQLNREHGDDDWSFYHVLHRTHGINDYEEAFLFEARSWTYAELRAEVGRLAFEFQRMGIGNRTVVAMFINNSPEFYLSWWALFKIGAIPAPINTAIAQQPFRHCLKITEAEFLICSYELYPVVASSLGLGAESLGPDGSVSDPRAPWLRSISIYDYGGYPAIGLHEGVHLIVHDQLPAVDYRVSAWPKEARPKIGPTDTSQYLFTSGTTGLPKAATWPLGYGFMSANEHRWPYMFEKSRRLYACTPMFHGGATYALLPATVSSGGCVILARKFSVRNFWYDIRRTRANMIFYIGEMVRFLVQAPPDPIHADETKHNGLEAIYGLGIAPPIWKEFRNRFGVPWITEYYGATEGTAAISYSNVSNDVPVGKVARWGPLMRSARFGNDTFYIIRIDMETQDVIRDPKTGLCIQCSFGEIGEAVNRIKPPLQRAHDYVGEGGREATEKKLLRDVFEHGDLFWRLGDALSMDHEGYVTFHDRLGDTFRAKGHNISTAEVETAFLDHPAIASANVYAIPMTPYGYDGQIGCAAVTMRRGASPDNAGADEKEALVRLEEYLTSKAGLPSYGVPRMVRVLVDNDEREAGQREQIGISDGVGGEYVSLMLKKLKTGLRKEAFSPPPGCRDRLYWVEREGRGFVPLDEETRKQLLVGKARL